jgi:6-phosphogluconate dehydrogenase
MALNVAEKGFPISVYNRTYEKTEAAVARAKKEGEVKNARSLHEPSSGRPHKPLPAGLGDKLYGHESMKDFIQSLKKPR